MDLKSLEISKEHLKNVGKNLEYNVSIGNNYNCLIAEARTPTEIRKFENKLDRLQQCNSLWKLDVYNTLLVKDFIKTNLCRDKFCNNCKKVKQSQRMAKFMPEITKANENYKLSQLVLTVPNVPGEQLSPTIKKHMFKAFTNLVKYLKKDKKIKGLEIDLGYAGAIRSLEVTFNENDYHPHLHVLVAHSKEIGQKKHINKYSYDHFGNREIRKFSDVEILIQKLWYLLFNDYKDLDNENRKRRKRITKDRLQELEIGYSCMIDEFQENDFLELFKYMTKGEKENSQLMDYENFKTLYFALDSVRQIQGYGVFFRIKDDDNTESVNEMYEELKNELNTKEMPEQALETVQTLINDNSFTLISKSKLHKLIKLTD